MTFSIVARDERTGAFGACGYTDISSYGAIVPHVSLHGAAATQAYANVDNGIEVMQLLHTGQSAREAGEAVLAGDGRREMRQLLVTGEGDQNFAWTGDQCIPWHGHRLERDHAVGANSIKSAAVINAISESFSASAEVEFTLRLIQAIQAGEHAGGHVDNVEVTDDTTGAIATRSTSEVFGGVMSAAVMVAAPEPEMWHNLRVDAHPSAIDELVETYNKARHSAKLVATFYKGSIRIKPYYWRMVGESEK